MITIERVPPRKQEASSPIHSFILVFSTIPIIHPTWNPSGARYQGSYGWYPHPFADTYNNLPSCHELICIITLFRGINIIFTSSTEEKDPKRRYQIINENMDSFTNKRAKKPKKDTLHHVQGNFSAYLNSWWLLSNISQASTNTLTHICLHGPHFPLYLSTISKESNIFALSPKLEATLTSDYCAHL